MNNFAANRTLNIGTHTNTAQQIESTGDDTTRHDNKSLLKPSDASSEALFNWSGRCKREFEPKCLSCAGGVKK